MSFYADLHIHSKYSRATSPDCDFEHLTLWAKRKGISVVGTGDFTHPAWWQEIQDKLEPAEPGLWRLKPELERAVDAQLPPSCRRPVRFMLEVEISTIYKKGDKTRKVHHLIYAAHLETAGRFRDALDAIGNIRSDGRPILGLDSRHLLEITLESGDDAFLIPAHIWTPWFSAMGSKSGFDSVDDCYGDLAPHIFAVETGLSSDPPMNWRISHLDRFTLVSSSDAHSPPMLGREANVFHTELDYFAMRRALETREGWGGTIEFFPDEGKYHLDGHRKCGVRLDPAETRRHQGRCPSCGKPVTVGVLHRVEQLADREPDFKPEAPADFHSLVPLPEVMSEIRGVGPKSKTIQGLVMSLTAKLGPELEILQELPTEDIERHADPLMVEAIRRLRRGEVQAEGGFDGEFGTIRVFQPDEIVPQLTLAPLFGDDFAAAPPPPIRSANLPELTADTEALGSIDSLADDSLLNAPDDRPLLERLDSDQRRAAEHSQGPLLIVAGPGSGKTRALTHRLAHLVESGTDARQCLAVTFTRRAAGEMRERLRDLLGDVADLMTVTTFHGLGLDLLRRHRVKTDLPEGFRIADDRIRRELVAERFGLSAAEARRTIGELVESRRQQDTVDFETVDLDSAAHAPDDKTITLDAYREVLIAEGMVDLDDLPALPVELLDRHPDLADIERRRFLHISVDEYQDIDALQYRLLRHLAAADGNLCAIGDPDQSIYRFRGADVGFFLRFQQDYPAAKTVELERNYRSQPTIVRAAQAIIKPSSLIPERCLRPVLERPSPVVLHEAASVRAEAEFVAHTIEELLGGTSYFSFDSNRVDELSERLRDDIAFNDIAVLTRTRAQTAPVLEALERAGLPVQNRSHQRLADHPAVRKLIHELHLRLDRDEALKPADLPTLVDELAAKDTGKDTGKDTKTAHAAALDLLQPLIDRHTDNLESFLTELSTGAEVDTWDPRAERISLLTLHASKGLEFPVVFIVGCDDGLLPLTWTQPTPDDGESNDHTEQLHEERRLFFVGATRARQLLILTRAKQRLWHGELRQTAPSPFLTVLGPDLVERRFFAGPKPKKKESTVQQLSLL